MNPSFLRTDTQPSNLMICSPLLPHPAPPQPCSCSLLPHECMPPAPSSNHHEPSHPAFSFLQSPCIFFPPITMHPLSSNHYAPSLLQSLCTLSLLQSLCTLFPPITMHPLSSTPLSSLELTPPLHCYPTEPPPWKLLVGSSETWPCCISLNTAPHHPHSIPPPPPHPHCTPGWPLHLATTLAVTPGNYPRPPLANTPGHWTTINLWPSLASCAVLSGCPPAVSWLLSAGRPARHWSPAEETAVLLYYCTEETTPDRHRSARCCHITHCCTATLY